jgi:integration host factor subunit beta
MLTKSALITTLKTRMPHATGREIQRCVEIVFGEMAAALAQGRRIELRGFGAFSIRTRNIRVPGTQKTGEAVPRATVYFRAGKLLRDCINEQ